MCGNCDNLGSVLARAGIGMTRRGFGRAAVLPGLLALGGSLACTEVQAQAAALPEPVRRLHAAIDGDAPRLIGIFKDLHAHPELAFMETRTAAIVERELKASGGGASQGTRGTLQ